MKKPAEAGLDPSAPGDGRDGRLTAIRLAVQSEAVHIFSFHGRLNRDVRHASRVAAGVAREAVGVRGPPAAGRGVSAHPCEPPASPRRHPAGVFAVVRDADVLVGSPIPALRP